MFCTLGLLWLSRCFVFYRTINTINLIYSFKRLTIMTIGIARKKEFGALGLFSNLMRCRVFTKSVIFRRAVLLFCLCVPVFAFAQTEEQIQQLERFNGLYKMEGNDVVFTKIIEGVSGTKNEIFPTVISFVATVYNSANDVIQQQDKEAGIVLCKGNFKLFDNGTNTWRCPHTLRVDVKDGRVRVVVTASQFMFHSKAPNMPDRTVSIVDELNSDRKANRKFYTEFFVILCESVEGVFNDLEKSLKSMDTNDDW